MTPITRPVASLVAAIMLATTACGNMAVPPPFEAAGVWKVDKGDRIIVVLKSGEKVEGKVEAVDEDGFVVSGQRVERTEIDEMWMKRGNVAASAGGVALFAVLAVVAFYMVLSAGLDGIDYDT